MNIEKANTEPFYRFLRFNEKFNRSVRIAIGALGKVAKTEANRLNKLNLIKLPTDGEPWGSQTKWKTTTRAIPDAKRFISQLGIVLVFSAFEDLLISVKAEYDRYSGFRGLGNASGVPNGSDSEGLAPGRLYRQLQWDAAEFDRVIPLFEYFESVRNCIVHRSGRASKRLIANALKPELAACVEGWHQPTGKRLPSLPTAFVDEEIALLPRHAILASEVCYRIALDLNARLRRFLDAQGLVCMAAYHFLLSGKPILTNARKSPSAVVNMALAGRYRVSLASREEATSLLKAMGKWKACISAFKNLFPES